ncbi:MAG: type IVB secretion system protein IcmH/DotU [Pseudomonadota bacterium]
MAGGNDEDDLDRTMIMPRPGGRDAVGASQPVKSDRRAPPPEPAALSDPPELYLGNFDIGRGNPLILAAATQFGTVAQLRETNSHPDPVDLRRRLGGEIARFEGSAKSLGASSAAIRAARYALCVLIDETVLGMPWGAESDWGRRSLLTEFHGETWGGEKFFQIIERAQQDVVKNIDLLEFLYLCLAFGLKGKYKVSSGGTEKLQAFISALYRTIANTRQIDPRADLSQNWQGVDCRAVPFTKFVPVWVVLLICAAILLVTYAGFSIMLNREANPVYETINNIGSDPLSLLTRRTSEEPIETVDIEGLLAPDIEAGRLTVFHEVANNQRVSTIRIQSAAMFPTGGANLNESLFPLVDRVGAALEQVSGPILVNGHTDATGLTTSNWVLSRNRAQAMADRIAMALSLKERLIVKGYAEKEPIAPNDTAENRARNRRVEITVVTGTADQSLD